MNTYLIDLLIQCGEYEKTSKTLITAKDADQAQDYAIFLEAHDPDNLEWSYNYAEDIGGEFAYRYNGIEEVPPSDVEVLSKYMEHWQASYSDLKNAGNWLEFNTSLTTEEINYE